MACPSKPSAELLEVLDVVPIPRSSIPDADLPVVLNRAPSLQPTTAPQQHDGTLRIHNRSVEEYQQLYHEVVDDMLKYVYIGSPDSFSLLFVTFFQPIARFFQI